MTSFFVGPYFIDYTICKVNEIVLKTGFPESELILLFFSYLIQHQTKIFTGYFTKFKKNYRFKFGYRKSNDLPILSRNAKAYFSSACFCGDYKSQNVHSFRHTQGQTITT